MNHRAIMSLTATLIMLAGCGQTGPLYMPDDQAAHAKYDPANDYALPSGTTRATPIPPQTKTPEALRQETPLAHTRPLNTPPSSTTATPASSIKVTPVTATPHGPQTQPQSAPLAPVLKAQPTAPLPSPETSAPAVPGKKWSTVEWTPYRAGVDQ